LHKKYMFVRKVRNGIKTDSILKVLYSKSMKEKNMY